MSDPLDWVRDAVFYEIFPDRFANGDPTNDPPGTVRWESAPTRTDFFGGDLAGITDRLGYLEELGVTALYLTPIFRAGTNHRYDTHDYLQVDPALGDEHTLRHLVAAAHDRGIRVVLDGVFNHVGDGFWAFRDVAANGPESRYWDWFIVSGHPLTSEPLNYQTCGGTSYLPKLDTTKSAVRAHILEVARHWIEVADIDGWRLDVPWKAAPELWQEFRPAVKAARGDAYLVGEIWHSWDGWFDAFDGLMNYQLRDRLLDFCVRDSMDAEDLAIEVRALLGRVPDPTLMLNLLGSHDTERLATIAQGDEPRVILALTALFTMPGAPMVYYGDEIGLEGGNDPDCRRAMPRDGAGSRRIRDIVQRLAEWRRSRVALRRGSWEAVLHFNRVLAYLRRHDEDAVLVVLNAGAARSDLRVTLPDGLDGPWIGDHGQPIRAEEGCLVLPHVPERGTILLHLG
jgi:glycosidase